jgi:hypothetical protein
MANQKLAFLYGLIFAVIIFVIGLFIGFTIENTRNNYAYQTYVKSETNLNDIKLQNEILTSFDIKNCKGAEKNNIDFGNKIYEEARVLENYEKSNEISDTIKFEHKKFDLLRAVFWINSINIKQKCNSTYVDVVYIYDYNQPSLSQKAEQDVISNTLLELRQQYGNDIILIPLSGDNDLTSIETLKSYYNITSLPSVLINEKIKVEHALTIEQMRDIINKELGIERL